MTKPSRDFLSAKVRNSMLKRQICLFCMASLMKSEEEKKTQCTFQPPAKKYFLKMKDERLFITWAQTLGCVFCSKTCGQVGPYYKIIGKKGFSILYCQTVSIRK